MLSFGMRSEDRLLAPCPWFPLAYWVLGKLRKTLSQISEQSGQIYGSVRREEGQKTCEVRTCQCFAKHFNGVMVVVGIGRGFFVCRFLPLHGSSGFGKIMTLLVLAGLKQLAGVEDRHAAFPLDSRKASKKRDP